jgi:phosphoribosyl 1,2-cyclic phosphodiesterase
MLGSNHKGAQRALEQAIAAERAKLVSAHAVQKCLYEVLLYAEAAHVVATRVEDAVDKLDSVHLHRVMQEAESGGTVEQDP